jgi:L-iditol 2-dehydrogenase
MAKLLSVTTAAVYDRGGVIQVRELPIAAPGEGELLVRIDACGICPGETVGWYVERKAPFVLGHEPVATIEMCGDEAGPFGVGERVFVHHHAPCLTCRHCARGEHVQCETWRTGRLIPGGMSQRAIVSAPIVAADVLPLPDSVDDDAGTFIEPLATVVKSMRRAGVRRGDRVLVIGLGVMGLLHVMLARQAGATSVIGADFVASRRAKALQLGADHAFGPDDLATQVAEATAGDGADVVIVGPGSAAAMTSGAACVARGGTMLLFAPLEPDARWPMPVHDLYFKDVIVTTSYSAGPDDTRAALHLIEAGLPVKSLVTHRFGLGDVRKAYGLVGGAGEALKVIVYPGRT